MIDRFSEILPKRTRAPNVYDTCDSSLISLDVSLFPIPFPLVFLAITLTHKVRMHIDLSTTRRISQPRRYIILILGLPSHISQGRYNPVFSLRRRHDFQKRAQKIPLRGWYDGKEPANENRPF